jgi:mannosyl-oligosaccharide glucosidase
VDGQRNWESSLFSLQVHSSNGDKNEKRPELGYDVSDSFQLDAINLVEVEIPGDEMWKMKDFVKAGMISNARIRLEAAQGRKLDAAHLFHLGGTPAENPSAYILQHMLEGEFQIEYTFVSNPEAGQAESKYSSDVVQQYIRSAEQAFDERFESVFQLKEKFNHAEIQMGKHMLSNMLGSVGYFFGTSIVDSSLVGYDDDSFDDDTNDEEDEYFEVESKPRPLPNPEEVGPTQLFTGVPSRPFFPRGFLWDSGFDSFLISKYHGSLSMDIISSWASLIDENGWVAREQILGEEARSKVPSEFQTQYPHYANPPIMVAALENHLANIHQFKLEGSVDPFAEIFVHQVYPKFRSQYLWFHNTQMAQVDQWDYGFDVELGFKWRGRKDRHILTSGILESCRIG